ncbi:MAG: helix-turn-helix domain-containing protein [Clostridiales bacterium]|jgi:AraC-like DNA-binding protein|nr:helix-turn-helix domain-containing protein [Clostridiales bacterium]
MDDKAFNELTVRIGYYSHRKSTPEWEIAQARLSSTDITYIIKGSAEYTINGSKYLVRAGDLLCAQKGWERRAHTFPEDLMECYCVSGPVLDGTFKETPLPFPFVSHVGIHQDILAMYHEINAAWLMREPGYELKARGIYMIILQRFFKLVYFGEYENNYDKRIKKAIEFMMGHFSENLTVCDVAGKVNLSPTYFGNFFKHATGKTFNQFLTNIRLNQAETMLRGGEHKINEVASACGFTEPFYFSRVFKLNRGICPSEILYSTKAELR